MLNSIRLKTTVLYSCILLIILIGYNILLLFSIDQILIKNIDDNLKIKAEEISHILQAYENINNTESRPRSLLEYLLHGGKFQPSQKLIIDDFWRAQFETLKLKEDYINILNIAGIPLLHSHNMTDKVYHLIYKQFKFSPQRAYVGNVINDKYYLRVINYPYAYRGRLKLIIQVAAPIFSTYKFLKKLMFLLLFSSIAILISTSFLGAFFAKRVLRPVVAVSSAADTISHKDLSVRIPVKEKDVEMKHLINAFNSMIERLDNSFKHANEFNALVAHELKTPLAVIRGEMELALEQYEDNITDKKILSDCLEEIDRMIIIVKDLLLIARVDYNPQILKFDKLDLEAFFKEIFEHSKILAQEKEIMVTLSLPQRKVDIYADKVHLRRLFLNIVINAIKFTPVYGKIRIVVRNDRNFIYADIADTGEGISEENLTKIFDKFFHTDTKEKSLETGSGLGLSIALSIAKAHQGDIQVKSILNKGTTFRVILPIKTDEKYTSS